MMRFALLLLALVPPAGDDASVPQGEPALEPPTLRSLGVSWVVHGDANRNAKIAVEYRKVGAPAWKSGPPLFRVEKGILKEQPDGWLFAGSLLLLEPDTAYEMRLKLSDPDGGSVEKTLKASTLGEPLAAPAAPARHVVPGSGGGTGSAADPFKGLAEAESRARPGDLFLVHAGSYPGIFTVKRSGEPGKPIVWRGAGDGDALIGGADAAREGIRADGVHDVWFERLLVRDKDYGFTAHEAAGLVIRRCRFERVKNGIYNARNSRDSVRGWWISDNVLEGVSPWPRPANKMDENEWRGIQLTGAGHVIAWNRVHHFKDAIDTFPSDRCVAIDIHNNDLSELNDDGIELDFSQRNVRCFENRIVNVHCGISMQPVLGGPAYVFRNVMYNAVNEPFKMHNRPSGLLVYHNTSVRKGMALQLFTTDQVHNAVLRNNLFVGTSGTFAYESTAKMVDCDFDYDGFGGGPWKLFFKWNEVRYATFEEMRAKAPVYHHAVQVDPAKLFASGAVPPADPLRPADREVDLRLQPESSAIDAGEVLPGFNDGYAGKGPDLGAFELGQELPHYGPRPEKK
jgi:hypothetical protein